MRQWINLITEKTQGYYTFEQPWIKLRAHIDNVKRNLKPGELVVLRGTKNAEAQAQSGNYHATYFTPDLSYVQDYCYDENEQGFIGVYVLNNLDRFIDLRYSHPEGTELYGNREFERGQNAKLIALAQKFYGVEEPLTTQVYDMLENPQPGFINMLRQDGYYGLLTSEGDFSTPVYAVFNEHINDCIRHVPLNTL